jgi:putative spermidine/putrescine transport system permease protein
MSLGANEVTTFFRVTLPLIKPGMIAGVLFSFILSFNNVTVSLFLARPGLQTLPVRIFYYIEAFPDPRISAISTVVVIFSLAFMIVLDRMFGLYKMFLPRATK